MMFLVLLALFIGVATGVLIAIVSYMILHGDIEMDEISDMEKE